MRSALLRAMGAREKRSRRWDWAFDPPKDGHPQPERTILYDLEQGQAPETGWRKGKMSDWLPPKNVVIHDDLPMVWVESNSPDSVAPTTIYDIRYVQYHAALNGKRYSATIAFDRFDMVKWKNLGESHHIEDRIRRETKEFFDSLPRD